MPQKRKQTKPSKPKAVRIPTDDFVVTVGGKTYYPHAGEWVEVRQRLSVRDMRAWARLGELSTTLQAMDDEDEQTTVPMLMEHFETILTGLADRITDWSWTDDDGEPLPKPDGSPEAFAELSTEEVYYLFDLIRSGESKAERKNGSRPGRTTGSATRQRASQT